MQSFPKDLRKPVMKSIDILSHFFSGMGSGCNKPAGYVSSNFFYDISYIHSHNSERIPSVPSNRTFSLVAYRF